ncbi:MAG: flagellar hook capping protein [Bacteroidetes bacterium]|jgi:flagellar basal-body rod modification protein FlgD|nr:flagellar hook capping protein [Bacteroidota bacterium]HOV99665.1 flagellar hook capping FlgD N-terminal domain-containing protein [Bacteroidota bacterium]
MTSSSIQSTNQTSSASSSATNSSSALGKEDFLNLLITQLKYQDPLNPLDGTEFAAQLAQFSSLEQLTNVNSNLEQFLSTNIAMSNSINNALAATFIGKEVRASTDSFKYSGENSVNFGYELASSAASVSIKIYDKSGTLVKTISGSTKSGNNSYEWDGVGDNGLKVASGTYSYTIEASDSGGTSLQVSPYIYGIVTGVRFKSDGTVFVIDGMEISLSNITEIKEK